jgi:hypothetical protein
MLHRLNLFFFIKVYFAAILPLLFFQTTKKPGFLRGLDPFLLNGFSMYPRERAGGEPLYGTGCLSQFTQ